MNNTLVGIDSAFCLQYAGLRAIQENIINQLNDYAFDLDKDEITQAVVNRMDAFWGFHVYNNKQLLHRTLNTMAADFFTETCLLYIKVYLEQNQGVHVWSEKSLPKRNEIHPDISVWRGDDLLAVIELKVSDGYKGKAIIEHLKEREKNIREKYPNCYFGAITFWDFFPETTEGLGSKYIAIKTHLKGQDMHPRTAYRIESLLQDLEKTTGLGR